MDRRQSILLEGIDLQADRGLEIGALHHPVVQPCPAVRYVDHASTEQLRDKYADDPAVQDIVDVDVVWADCTLQEAMGGERDLDFVIASHVIEHVPDLVAWLEEIATVLRPGGVLSLAVPDKRFCFDARRRVTDVAEIIEAHLTARTRPSLAATFDFWTRYDAVDTAALWAGAPPPPTDPLRDAEALERTRAAASSPDYRDVHCWVFTPDSFLEALERLAALGLLPDFALRSFHTTEPGELEFFAALVKLDAGLTIDERRGRQADSIRRHRATLPLDPLSPTQPEAPRLTLSPREERLIAMKRRLLSRLRTR